MGDILSQNEINLLTEFDSTIYRCGKCGCKFRLEKDYELKKCHCGGPLIEDKKKKYVCNFCLKLVEVYDGEKPVCDCGREMVLKEKKVDIDVVNHPNHYNAGSIEVIYAIEDWKLGFCLGNVVKYVARAGHKGSTLEDLKKALWYLEREIKRLEKEAGL